MSHVRIPTKWDNPIGAMRRPATRVHFPAVHYNYVPYKDNNGMLISHRAFITNLNNGMIGRGRSRWIGVVWPVQDGASCSHKALLNQLIWIIIHLQHLYQSSITVCPQNRQRKRGRLRGECNLESVLLILLSTLLLILLSTTLSEKGTQTLRHSF